MTNPIARTVWAASLVACASVSPSTTQPVEDTSEGATSSPLVCDGSAEATARVLREQCYACHGQDLSARGGLGAVLESRRLVHEGLVVPGSPDDSPLLRALTDPSTTIPAHIPDEATTQLIQDWIACEAPTFDARQDVPVVSRAEEIQAISTDLASVTSEDLPYTRYLSFVSAYNQGLQPDQMHALREATRKLLHHTNRGTDWAGVTAVSVGAQGALLYRLQIQHLGWDLHRTRFVPEGDGWERLVSADPTAVFREDPEAAHHRALTGSRQPVLDAAWFVTQAAGPAYDQLLDLPKTLDAFLALYGIDATKQIERGRVSRAGLLHSSVSPHHRLVERFESGEGTCWVTRDFSDAFPSSDLTLHPTSHHADDALNFRPASHHAICLPPHGLPTFFLADADNQAARTAPWLAVRDHLNPPLDDLGRSVNPVSCFRCHEHGLFDAPDEVGPTVLSRAAEYPVQVVEQVEETYDNQAVREFLAEDNRRWHAALQSADLSGSSSVEPISAAVHHARRDLDARDVAAILRTTKDVFETWLTQTGESFSAWAPLLDQGYIPRADFDALAAQATCDLGLGTCGLGECGAGELPCTGEDRCLNDVCAPPFFFDGICGAGESGPDCDGSCEIGEHEDSADCDGRCDRNDQWSSWPIRTADCDGVCKPGEDPESTDCDGRCQPGEAGSADCDGICGSGDSNRMTNECNGACEVGDAAFGHDCNRVCERRDDAEGPDCVDTCDGFYDTADSPGCNGVCDGRDGAGSPDCDGICDLTDSSHNDCDGLCSVFDDPNTADCDDICDDAVVERDGPDCNGICERREDDSADCNGVCDVLDLRYTGDCDGVCSAGEEGVDCTLHCEPTVDGDESHCECGEPLQSPLLGTLRCQDYHWSGDVGCRPGRDDAFGHTCLGSDEQPVFDAHHTRLARVAPTEVSRAMWLELFQLDPSFGRIDPTCMDCPVVGVTWWDTLAFANALSQRERLPTCYTLVGCRGTPGLDFICDTVEEDAEGTALRDCIGYRLPTESEWELAARAGLRHPIGDQEDPALIAHYGMDVACAVGTSDCGPLPVCSRATVGSGLCDMNGNVAEWVWNPYGLYPTWHRPLDYRGQGLPAHTRVIRGGAWHDDAAGIRNARRDFADRNTRRDDVGFRLVRGI